MHLPLYMGRIVLGQHLYHGISWLAPILIPYKVRPQRVGMDVMQQVLVAGAPMTGDADCQYHAVDGLDPGTLTLGCLD